MIKKLLLLILFSTSTLLAETDAEKKFVDNLHQLIEAKASWPGFRLSHPIVIAFDNGHLYGFQLKTPDKAWQKIGDQLWFSSKDPWAFAKIPFSPFHPLGSEQAMIFHVSSDRERALFAVVHETFHLHQFTGFPSSPVLKAIAIR